MCEEPLEAKTVYALVLKTDASPNLQGNTRKAVIGERAASLEAFRASFGQLVNEKQVQQIYVGFCAMRQALSIELTQNLMLVFLEEKEIRRYAVLTSDIGEQIKEGGVAITWPAMLNLDKGRRGRPTLSHAQHAVREGIICAIGRITILGHLARDNNEQEAYDEMRQTAKQMLTPLQPDLFHLGVASNVSALDHGEENGSTSLSKLYQQDWSELEPAMLDAFKSRVSEKGYRAALEDELRWLNGLADWAHAMKSRREGERTRAITIERAMDRALGADSTAPLDQMTAPRMHDSVRASLMPKSRLEALPLPLLVELCTLFGLEDARETLLSRQFIIALLAVSAMAGALVMRRQKVVIDTTWKAAGLIALNQSYGYIAPNDLAHDQKKEIVAMQTIARELLETYPTRLPHLSSESRRYLMGKIDAYPLLPSTEKPLFFFD